MSKALIRKLFAQPPPSIEEILAQGDEAPKSIAVVEESNTNYSLSTPVVNVINQQHNVNTFTQPAHEESINNQRAQEAKDITKVLSTASSNTESNGSSLSPSKISSNQATNDFNPFKLLTVSTDKKRKEPDMGAPAISPANKKLKPSSLANGVSPIQSMSSSGRSSPSVKKENSPATAQAQQGFSFIDNLLAGLKNSAANSPTTASSNNIPSSSAAHPPQAVVNVPLQVLSNQRPPLLVNFPYPPSPLLGGTPNPNSQQMSPSLYPTSNPALQELGKNTKLTRQQKKRLKQKKRKQQKAAQNHQDIYRDMDDMDFDTLLQEHEKVSKAKEAPSQAIKVNGPIASSTVVVTDNQALLHSQPTPTTTAVVQSQMPLSTSVELSQMPLSLPTAATAQPHAPLPSPAAQRQMLLSTAVVPETTQTLQSHTHTSKAKTKISQPKAFDPLAGYIPAKSLKSKSNHAKFQEPINKPKASPALIHGIRVSPEQSQTICQTSASNAKAPVVSHVQQSILQKESANALAVSQTAVNVITGNGMMDDFDNAELLLRSATIKKNTQNNKKSGANGKKVQNKGQQQDNKRKFIPTVPCSFFMKGFCKDGDKCTFKHEGNPTPPAPPTKLTTVCQFFKTGSCVAGDDCKFSHNLKLEPCRFFHLQGSCELDVKCPYSHEPLNEDRLQRLRILTGPCRFYHFKGYCNTGDLCMFSHDEVSDEEKKKVESTILACRYYHLKGACRSGDDCFYLHQEASPEQIKNLQPF